MRDPLSRQIRAFRDTWSKLGEHGYEIRPEAVQMMDSLFASFQAQAKLLESGGLIAGAGEKLIADVAAEARLCQREVLLVEDFVKALRARRQAQPSNVVAFRRAPSSGAARRVPPEGEGGGAA